MPYCTKCREWNDEDAVYCNNCGHRLGQSRDRRKCPNPKCKEGYVRSGMPPITWGVGGASEWVECPRCHGKGYIED